MVARNALRERSTRAPVLLCLTLGVAAACGPSLSNVHEGTVRFEHCNRLDLDERVQKGECRKCWTTWLHEYTYGQPRDRIDYARRRAKSLANGDERPALKFDERSPEERQFYLVVPGPTSVHAPPPPVATVVKNGGGDAGSLAKTTDEAPPAESCADQCRTTWKTCGVECSTGQRASNAQGTSPAPGGSGSPHAPGNGQAPKMVPNGSHAADWKTKSPAGATGHGCSAKCGSDYSSCMKRCFE
jgi:hypothetical protein